MPRLGDGEDIAKRTDGQVIGNYPPSLSAVPARAGRERPIGAAYCLRALRDLAGNRVTLGVRRDYSARQTLGLVRGLAGKPRHLADPNLLDSADFLGHFRRARGDLSGVSGRSSVNWTDLVLACLPNDQGLVAVGEPAVDRQSRGVCLTLNRINFWGRCLSGLTSFHFNTVTSP